jgi:hypothetical protein
MARLAAVEAAFFGEHHPVVQAEGVDHGGADAARGGGAGDDDAVGAEQGQIGGEVRAEKAGRLLLADHDVLWARRDRRDDLVAVERRCIGPGRRRAARLVGARTLPAPAAAVPSVGPPFAGRVDDRETFGARLVDQGLDVVERDPGLFAAGGAPALDRVEDRLGPLAAERPVDVDHQQCRPLAEAGAGAEPAGGEHRLVALGQKLVPHGLAHRRSPLGMAHPKGRSRRFATVSEAPS